MDRGEADDGAVTSVLFSVFCVTLSFCGGFPPSAVFVCLAFGVLLFWHALDIQKKANAARKAPTAVADKPNSGDTPASSISGRSPR